MIKLAKARLIMTVGEGECLPETCYSGDVLSRAGLIAVENKIVTFAICVTYLTNCWRNKNKTDTHILEKFIGHLK